VDESSHWDFLFAISFILKYIKFIGIKGIKKEAMQIDLSKRKDKAVFNSSQSNPFTYNDVSPKSTGDAVKISAYPCPIRKAGSH